MQDYEAPYRNSYTELTPTMEVDAALYLSKRIGEFKNGLEMTNPELFNAPNSVINETFFMCDNFNLDVNDITYDSDPTGGVTSLSYKNTTIAAFDAETGKCFKRYDEALKDALADEISHDSITAGSDITQ